MSSDEPERDESARVDEEPSAEESGNVGGRGAAEGDETDEATAGEESPPAEATERLDPSPGDETLLERPADGRLYGRERLRDAEPTADRALLTNRQLRLLQLAPELDRETRNSHAELLRARLDRLLNEEWPVVAESYPEFAELVREAVCEGDEAGAG